MMNYSEFHHTVLVGVGNIKENISTDHDVSSLQFTSAGSLTCSVHNIPEWKVKGAGQAKNGKSFSVYPVPMKKGSNH